MRVFVSPGLVAGGVEEDEREDVEVPHPVHARQESARVLRKKV